MYSWHLSGSVSISFICNRHRYSCTVNQRHLGYNCQILCQVKIQTICSFKAKKFDTELSWKIWFHVFILLFSKSVQKSFLNDVDSLCTHPAEGYKWYEKEIQYRRRRGGFQYCRFITFATIVPQMDGEGRGAQWKYLCVCAIVDIPIVCTCLLERKYPVCYMCASLSKIHSQFSVLSHLSTEHVNMPIQMIPILNL